jgi:hypothetical protein
LALPSIDGGLTVVVVEDADVLEVLAAAGTKASVTAPKSLPCEEPNDSVAAESPPDVTSYWA